MKKLLITDLDDTLYNWIDFFIPAFYAMVEELSIITGIKKELLLQEYKEKHQFYGSVEFPFVTLLLPSIINKYKGLPMDETKKILNEAFHRFNSVRKEKLKLFPNVENTLDILHKKGITIIGYTESSQENGFYRLKKLGIEKYFKYVYTSSSMYKSDYTTDPKVKNINTKKPDKKILLSICRDECCEKKDAVYVGDSLTKDVYMAIDAGITSVWFRSPKENSNYYSMLVDISSWTEDDFIREQKLKKIWNENNMKPDYEISDFKLLLNILLD